MKKIIFSTVLLMGTFSVFADANLKMEDKLYEKNVYEEQSYFETLGDLFSTGQAPQIEKLINVAWAGRCFKNTEPNKPINTGYIFRVAKKADVGPLGREKDSYEVASYWSPSKAPNYYDTMTLDEVYEEHSNLIFSSVKSTVGGVSINMNKKDLSVLKLSGEYLIEDISTLKGDDVGPLGENKYETWVRCYYFIPEYARN